MLVRNDGDGGLRSLETLRYESEGIIHTILHPRLGKNYLELKYWCSQFRTQVFTPKESKL